MVAQPLALKSMVVVLTRSVSTPVTTTCSARNLNEGYISLLDNPSRYLTHTEDFLKKLRPVQNISVSCPPLSRVYQSVIIASNFYPLL